MISINWSICTKWGDNSTLDSNLSSKMPTVSLCSSCDCMGFLDNRYESSLQLSPHLDRLTHWLILLRLTRRKLAQFDASSSKFNTFLTIHILSENVSGCPIIWSRYILGIIPSLADCGHFHCSKWSRYLDIAWLRIWSLYIHGKKR